MICATFNGNSCTTITSCYSPTNETDITTLYDRLSSLVRHIPKYNVLIIIDGDMNVQISKDKNNKFGLHNLPKRNGEYITDFSHKNSLTCLSNKFKKKKKKKRKEKSWIYTNPNKAKAPLDYMFINKKWINSILNWGTLLFWKNIFQSQNSHGKDMPGSTLK